MKCVTKRLKYASIVTLYAHALSFICISGHIYDENIAVVASRILYRFTFISHKAIVALNCMLVVSETIKHQNESTARGADYNRQTS